MFVNLDIADSLFPGIVTAAEHARGGKGKSILILIISSPIPVSVCYVWYRLFNWLDKKLENVSSRTGEEDS